MLIAELPQPLQEKFEHTVQLLHHDNHTGVQQALVEAIELWLSQQHQKIVDAEAVINNQVYEQLRNQLAQQYPGKWIVIAQGMLQGVGDTLDELNQLAPTARHRLVTQIGISQAKEIDLGWQMAFV